MKKLTKDYEKKTIAEIEKEILTLRAEIGKIRVERQVNPQKDSNLVGKKIKRIAALNTYITDKQITEVMNRESKG